MNLEIIRLVTLLQFYTTLLIMSLIKEALQVLQVALVSLIP